MDNTQLDELNFGLNKVIVHPQFDQTLEDIKKLKLSLPEYVTSVDVNEDDNFSYQDTLVEAVGNIEKLRLNPKSGQLSINSKVAVAAYDESINRFDSLEGVAYFSSHSLVVLGKEGYIPVNYLTFYFYTRSKGITDKSKYIKFSVDPERDSKKDFIQDKINFLVKTAPENTLLLIDGPLVGGDYYTFMIHALERFEERGILPIFFVKNSSSNLVTNYVPELQQKYNSDLHWSYVYLREGERTSFFKYTDRRNKENAKIFCYLKSFNVSPQRVEMHIGTYNKYKDVICDIMDTVYYLTLAQGDKYNPQARPIAVAENYARTVLSLVNINRLVKDVGIIPTMNQSRFGWF